MTDHRGRYSTSLLRDDGTYEFVATAGEEFAAIERGVEIPSGESVRDLVLRDTLSIEGLVTNSDGAPRPGRGTPTVATDQERAARLTA